MQLYCKQPDHNGNMALFFKIPVKKNHKRSKQLKEHRDLQQAGGAKKRV